MVAELRKRWKNYVSSFNGLGCETYGMTPTAACLLFVTAVDYCKDNSKGGFQPIRAGKPSYAMFSDEDSIVDIRSEYSGCKKFWELDDNYQRARITLSGVEYVEQHIDVFKQLLES